MIEVHSMPAPSEEHRRLMWAVYSSTIRQLLPAGVLGADALKLIRQDLRIGLWTAASVPESHRTQHIELLNDVTEAWASMLDPAMRVYFEVAGDLLPSAPDSPAGLTP